MDMGRLNDLIGRNGRRAHELDDATGALEREFVQELRDLEVVVTSNESLNTSHTNRESLCELF